MTDEKMIRGNVNAVLQPLSDREECVKDYVLNNILAVLKIKDWEGVEVKEYWKSFSNKDSKTKF